MEFWIIQTLNATSFGMLLFLLCAGFSLVFGLMNILNLAHGSCYLLGAYVGLSFIQLTNNYLIGLIFGGIGAGIIGFLMQRFLVNRVYGKRLLQVLLTMGCMFIIGDGAILFWGADPVILAKPRCLASSLHFAGVVFPSYRLFIIAIGGIFAIGLWFFQEKTKWGAIIRAAVDDELMARAVGINVSLLLVLVFTLGTALTGISAVLGGPFVGIYPGIDLEILLLAVIVVIIGGLGSMKGAFFASLIVAFMDNFGKAFFPELAMFTLFAPLIVIIAIKPTGLWGRS